MPFWLILAFYSLQFRFIFIHYLPLSILSISLCFDGYSGNFTASEYDTVITGVAFWAVFDTPECFRWKSVLLLHKFSNIHALKKYLWLYNGYFLCEKSQTLLLKAVWEEEAVTVLERIWEVFLQTQHRTDFLETIWICLLSNDSMY